MDLPASFVARFEEKMKLVHSKLADTMKRPEFYLEKVAKLEKQLLDDPDNVELLSVLEELRDEVKNMENYYNQKRDFKGAVEILERKENVTNKISFLKGEEKNKKLMAIHLSKMINLLDLGEKEKAKNAVIRVKELADKVIQDGNEEDQEKARLDVYQCYYSYYKNPLIDNFKKAIDNGVGLLKFTLKFDVAMFLETGLNFSKYCITKTAFKQSEYILRCIEHILIKEKEKFTNFECEEMRLNVQQVTHMQILLANIAINRKCHDYFKCIPDIPEVPADGDKLLDGSTRDVVKLREVYEKAKSLNAKTIEEFGKHVMSLPKNFAERIVDSIENNKTGLAIAHYEYGV